MSNYYLKAILLKGCSYSNSASELMTLHQIPVKAIWVEQSEKENYKNNLINTFPQIYLKKNGNVGNLLLGGYQELYDFTSTFLGQKLSHPNIDTWIKKTGWSKKSTLRLIQLINKINSK